jgi:hypothetical protein
MDLERYAVTLPPRDVWHQGDSYASDRILRAPLLRSDEETLARQALVLSQWAKLELRRPPKSPPGPSLVLTRSGGREWQAAPFEPLARAGYPHVHTKWSLLTGRCTDWDLPATDGPMFVRDNAVPLNGGEARIRVWDSRGTYVGSEPYTVVANTIGAVGACGGGRGRKRSRRAPRTG